MLTNIVDNHVGSTVLFKPALNSIGKFANLWLHMHVANSFPENVFSEEAVVGIYFVYTQIRIAYSKNVGCNSNIFTVEPVLSGRPLGFRK